MFRVKRVYLTPSREDGYRVLVDRLWPRGLKKEKAKIDDWQRELAPSAALRRWYGHDPKKWDAFRTRYAGELSSSESLVRRLRAMAKKRTVTLLFAARDEARNNAVALKEHLESATRRR
jgi:uncharacterized protein YeaO (DUF488 family)